MKFKAQFEFSQITILDNQSRRVFHILETLHHRILNVQYLTAKCLAYTVHWLTLPSWPLVFHRRASTTFLI